MANPITALFRRGELKNTAVLDESSDLFRLFVGQYSTATGINVNSDSAIASVAVLACLIVRSESLMIMPADVFRKEGRDRISEPDHPVAQLIADAPNPLLSAEEFWRWKQITEDLKGNAYVRIKWNRGKPVALYPLIGLQPDIVLGGVKDPDRIVYRYAGDDFTAAGDYAASDIMHFKGALLSKNPYQARSLIEATAENIGLGIATESFFARFLGNGNHFPMYLQTDEKLIEDDVKALRKQMEGTSGILPAGQTRIFDRGLKVMQNPMSLKDADLSGHQRWILEQVCRTFRVPLPMVQDLTHGTYTNTEQADLWLSKYTALPIARNTEAVIRRKLFLPSERGTYYARFNVNAMMRGDFTARTAGYSVLVQTGIMSPNEARAFEDWNPYDGGDEFRIPLNLGPAGQEDPTETASPPDTNANALAPLLSDAKQRIVARHEQNVERGRTRSESLDFAIKVLSPIVETAQSLGIEINAEQIAAAIIDAIKNEVDVPAYVSENAQRGLEYYEQGLGGDGLVEQTIRDARDMVAGTIRDAKVRLIAPWIARHLVDLDAPQNNDPEDPAYPGPGLVAMLLWGAGPDKEGARRTADWAEAEAARLEEGDNS
jgi:HK97 family phage portal protein